MSALSVNPDSLRSLVSTIIGLVADAIPVRFRPDGDFFLQSLRGGLGIENVRDSRCADVAGASNTIRQQHRRSTSLFIDRFDQFKQQQ